jgi:hypothetical protein
MSYVAGDKISTAEYNTQFLDGANVGSGYGINHIASTGQLYHGLGQTGLNSVATGEKITATQWNSLFTAMDNVANHTNDTLTSTGQRSTGDKIEIKSALISDLQTLAASVQAGCPNATALTTSAAQQTTAASGRWNVSHIVEQSITFSTADQMRFFFNQGGKIIIEVTRTGNAGSAATSKDRAIDDLIDSLGSFRIKSQASDYSVDGSTDVNILGDGSSTYDLNIGFYDLTTSYQKILILRQDWQTYEFMNFQFEAKLNAAPGTATVMTVRTSLLDPFIDGSTNSVQDTTWTSGNTASVDQYANFVGVTNVVLKYQKATTAEGLSLIFEPFSTAVVSNNIIAV